MTNPSVIPDPSPWAVRAVVGLVLFTLLYLAAHVAVAGLRGNLTGGRCDSVELVDACPRVLP